MMTGGAGAIGSAIRGVLRADGLPTDRFSNLSSDLTIDTEAPRETDAA
jgi:hypothetical protein